MSASDVLGLTSSLSVAEKACLVGNVPAKVSKDIKLIIWTI